MPDTTRGVPKFKRLDKPKGYKQILKEAYERGSVSREDYLSAQKKDQFDLFDNLNKDE